MQLDRRSFLQVASAAAAAPALTGLLSRLTLSRPELAADAGQIAGGYGPIRPVKSENTGEEILALPEGFKYTVFGRTGDMMKDGNATPGAHDGMAAFAHAGVIRLIRNHEVRNQPTPDRKPIGDVAKSYDPLAGGGTSTLDIDPVTRLIKNDFASISGTMVNCAGGPTPGQSWITCEETVVGQAQGYGKEHGYIFEVSSKSNGLVDPTPIRAAGRRVHEACATDPETGILYITEDRGTSGLYRYVPVDKDHLAKGGELQMLAVKGKAQFDTRKGQTNGVKYDAVWVTIDTPDPDPAKTERMEQANYSEGLAKGGATFARLEGCWYGNGSIYAVSTNGGDKNLGQVWRYIPGTRNEGILELIFESPDPEIMESPDNLCVTPRGALAVCEDGGGDNFLRGITREGRVFSFAKNNLNKSELAGVCFSPDGNTLFFNLQTPGLTVAIWGDFARGSF
ncbi:MAG: PhoX family protein [Fimbriimonadaceae bacterium]|nr:PhoX family protein [Fimbriimonadaceae bacterium]